jgi:hypothetical protein
MTTPAAIQATFADYRRVRGRKVGQLVFEVPLEQLHDAIASLGGEPSVEQDTWVAIARLNDAPAAQSAGAKWMPPDANFPVKQAVLTCKKEAFWQFIRESVKSRCDNEEDAATYVRRVCRVNSRSDFATNPEALQRWNFLLSAFNAWMAYSGGAAA